MLIDLPDEEAKRLQETAWDAIEEIDAKELNKVATYGNSEGIAVKSTSPHNKLVFIIAAVAATGGLLFGLQDCAFSTSGLVNTAPAYEMITAATRQGDLAASSSGRNRTVLDCVWLLRSTHEARRALSAWFLPPHITSAIWHVSCTRSSLQSYGACRKPDS